MGEIGKPLRTIEIHPPESPVPEAWPEFEPDREHEPTPEREPAEVEQ
jgi:hypothetical protein